MMLMAREEQVKREQQFINAIKQPVEDLELTDSKDIPDLPRFPNYAVTEDTFSDVLMIVEFLHAFGEVSQNGIIAKSDVKEFRKQNSQPISLFSLTSCF